MRIGITGHQKLSDETAWTWVKSEISRVLRENGGKQAVTSLAIGADQVFAQVALKEGYNLLAVVPCSGYESTFDSEKLQNYKKLLEKSLDKVELNFSEPSEEAFYAAGEKVLELSDILVAVWNGKPAKGLGGTGDIVDLAIKQNKQVIHINPDTKKVIKISHE